MAAEPDLGLNLVFSAPPGAGGGGGAGGKKPKRKTKYDKRRERGRLAKLAKEERKQQSGGLAGGRDGGTKKGQGGGLDGTERDVSGSDAGGTLAGIAAALGGGSAKRAPRTASAASAGKDATLESDANAKKNDKLSASADVTETTRQSKEVTAPVLDKDAGQRSSGDEHGEDGHGGGAASSNEPSAPAPESAVPSTKPTQTAPSRAVEDPANSSRRQRTATALDDEQRARYLSEFHARPRELDRTARAARDIKASRPSDHIFGRDGDGMDVEEEDGEDGSGVGGTANEGREANDNDTCEGDATASCPFRRLGVHPHLASTLTSPDKPFRLEQPTIVQSRSIAALLPTKRTKNPKKKKKLEQNLFIQSETGSGKTLAYLLPILQHLAVNATTQQLKRVDRQLGGTRAILLCPTRELATQTYACANDLCRTYPWIVPGCLSGGEKRKSEKARLRKGITILIATPGRLLDHLSKTESLLLALKNKLEWLVLDEADRLLDAGLGGQVEQIVQHLRSNQPGAGPNRDGVSWRSVLVSATVTKELEGLAKTALGGDGGWMWARGHTANGDTARVDQAASSKGDDDGEATSATGRADHELDHAAPRQLAQLYMVVSAKLRLASLVAFLAARAAKGERTVVFLSTCDSVDYHHALFASMESILGDKDDDDGDGTSSATGIFGQSCPIYKLHGDIPHQKRLSTLQSFSSDRSRSSILLATDVAARGLNFPSLDWIVQYDPPCETKDYVHRAGRSARAGNAGHALLFLLPSERQYVEVLRLRGLDEVSALSLSSTLSAAAGLCAGVAREGAPKAAGNTFSDGRGEAFTLAIQTRLEECVVRDDAEYKASMAKKVKGMDPKQRRRQKREAVGPLLEGARKAFSAFVRAYPAKERAVRHIFNARALHLGHVARSLALKETPKMVSRGNNGAGSAREKARDGGGKGEKRKSRLAFGDNAAEVEAGDGAAIRDEEQERNLSLLGAIGSGEAGGASGANKKPKKSSSGSGGGKGKDVQKRMMEAAMLMQAQEFM